MDTSKIIILASVALVTGAILLLRAPAACGHDHGDHRHKAYPVTKSTEEWKKQLTPQQYRILRQKGTERAFTGEYWNEKRAGVYRCAGCNQPLFSSDHKFRSGTGWPSYYTAIAPGRVDTESDTTYGMVRTEILCSKCGGHLGHVFRDGPKPTGLRYCVNSASLTFDPGATTDPGVMAAPAKAVEDKPAEARGAKVSPKPEAKAAEASDGAGSR